MTKITRQTVKYRGGEIVNGQLKGGKVARIKIVTKTLRRNRRLRSGCSSGGSRRSGHEQKETLTRERLARASP